MQQNEMRLIFDSRSCNESFARVVVAAFMTQLNPTIEEVDDVKTAVSEAVTNVIIHAYGGKEIRGMPGADDAMEFQTMPGGWTDAAGKNNVPKRRQENTEYDLDAADKIEIRCRIWGDMLEVVVSDTGCGIADVKQAMEPLFTTRMECDRAGMGFSFMEAFMDTLEVDSALGKGTCVRMTKRIARGMRKTGAADDSHGNAEGREDFERYQTNREVNDAVVPTGGLRRTEGGERRMEEEEEAAVSRMDADVVAAERQEPDRWSIPLR